MADPLYTPEVPVSEDVALPQRQTVTVRMRTGHMVEMPVNPTDTERQQIDEVRAAQPGWGTTAAEVIGGTLGGLATAELGPVAPLGAAAGMAGGGMLADYIAGRPIKARTTEMRALYGGLSDVGGKMIGAAGRYGAGKLAEASPAFERILTKLGVTGVTGPEERALEASGAKLTGQTAERTGQRAQQKMWSQVSDPKKYGPVFNRLIKMNPEDFLKTVFKPGNNTEMRIVKHMLSDDHFSQLVERNFEEVFKRSSVTGRFAPGTFATEIRGLENSGQLAEMVDAETRTNLLAFAKRYVGSEATYAREALGKAASGAGAGLGFRLARDRGTHELLSGMHPAGLAASSLALLTPTGRRVVGAAVPQAAGSYLRTNPPPTIPIHGLLDPDTVKSWLYGLQGTF